MKSCANCKWADWKRTPAGKLHPSGDGQCNYPVEMPVLPAAYYWVGGQYPSGGNISRRGELLVHCPTFHWNKP